MQLVFLLLQFGEKAAQPGETLVAEPDEVALSLAQIAPRSLKSDRPTRLPKLREPGPVLRAAPGLDRASVERAHLFRNHQVDIVVDGVAEALAARTGSERTVEAEQARLGLVELHAASLAGELLAEAQTRRRVLASPLEDDLTGLAITDFHGIDDPLPLIRPDRDTIRQHE